MAEVGFAAAALHFCPFHPKRVVNSINYALFAYGFIKAGPAAAAFKFGRADANHPDEIELALWFHDAIYEIRAPDNELKSADWAGSAVLAAGGSEAAAQRVHALVLVTRHDSPPQTPDQEILLDVDLAILGAPPAVFGAYEAQVRAEYSMVPAPDFRSNRRRILQGFLARPRIFHTPGFNTRLEAQARANLQRSVAALAD